MGNVKKKEGVMGSVRDVLQSLYCSAGVKQDLSLQKKSSGYQSAYVHILTHGHKSVDLAPL